MPRAVRWRLPVFFLFRVLRIAPHAGRYDLPAPERKTTERPPAKVGLISAAQGNKPRQKARTFSIRSDLSGYDPLYRT